jgi:hypothetical protein
MAYAPFRESVAVTRRLLEELKELTGGHLMVFSVDSSPVETAALRGLVADLGIQLVEGVGSAVAAAEASGVSVRAADGGHWNDHGHAIAAEVLLSAIRQRLGVPRDTRAEASGSVTSTPQQSELRSED